MKHLIDKDTLVAEIERLKKHSQMSKLEFVNDGYTQNAFAEDCRIVSFNKLLSFLDTLEVIEIGVDVGSPEGDLGCETVQVIDADGNINEVTFNKAQKGESV